MIGTQQVCCRISSQRDLCRSALVHTALQDRRCSVLVYDAWLTPDVYMTRRSCSP